jgi:hypothetical protein
MQMILDEWMQRLVAADPRQAMDESLTVLMNKTGASTSGLFMAYGSQLELVVAGRIDQAGIDRVQAAWTSESERLRDGRPTLAPTYCVWPLESENGTPLIYLGGSIPIQEVRKGIAELGSMIENAMVLERAGKEANSAAIESFLAATPRGAVERRQLLTHLNLHEWNLSRVARAAGVTRATIYQRMRRYNIARLRIRKTKAKPA